MKEISRREALRLGVAACGAAAVGSPATRWASANPRGPNDRLRLGVIGTGVRGKYLIGNLPESVQVASICDCAASRIASTLEPKGEFEEILDTFRRGAATRCTTHQDYRRMLERENLDAVIIATPDHHHAQAAMLALQAGLDVYLEKPVTVTIREGRLLAEMVKKTGRILQVGSQQRTMEMNRFACEFIRDGGLGKISKVELPNYPGPLGNPQLPEEAPEGLDWNLFLGPTSLRAHNRKLWVKDEFKVGSLVWRGWDLFRDFSGHLMTNWGAHSIDMLQYALGKDDSGPELVHAIQPESVPEIYRDWAQKTPSPDGAGDRRFWPVRMRYADGVEVTFRGANAPIRFHGERGTMDVSRNAFQANPTGLITNPPDPAVADKWNHGGHVARPHLQNWLDCIRSRREPNAPIEVGHRTATICHLANIARELGRPLRWDPARETFIDDQAANRWLDRPRRAEFQLPAIS